MELYASDTNQKGSWAKVAATVSVDDATGRILVKPLAAIMTRYAKVHCVLDSRDENLAAAQASFANIASGILRVGYYAQESSATYTYDGQGNRASTSTTKGESRLGLSRTDEDSVYHLWDNSDRIKKIEKITVLDGGVAVTTTWAYVYDALGNLVEKGDAFTESGDQIAFLADSGHYVRYRYDLWNRLVEVWKGDAGTVSATQAATYEYDPTGLRIQKTSRSTRTSYVYGIDGSVLRETRDETMLADVTIDYVYALGRLAGWIETTGGIATKYWATTDHLGSVTAATDSGGSLAMRRDFSAFGDSIDAVLETAAGPRYTGKDYDEDAELYYFNARWYDAELGRFTTEDPARDDVNWYVYVNDSPLANVDPTGMWNRRDAGFVPEIETDPGDADNYAFDVSTSECDTPASPSSADKEQATGTGLPRGASIVLDVGSNMLESLSSNSSDIASSLFTEGNANYWFSSGGTSTFDDFIKQVGADQLVKAGAQATKMKMLDFSGSALSILSWIQTGIQVIDSISDGQVGDAGIVASKAFASAYIGKILAKSMAKVTIPSITKGVLSAGGGFVFGELFGLTLIANAEAKRKGTQIALDLYGSNVGSGKMSISDWFGYAAIVGEK